MSQNNNSSDGIGFLGLLQILFIGLKLADIIDWSWWLVMLPSIIGVSLWIIVVGIALAIASKN